MKVMPVTAATTMSALTNAPSNFVVAESDSCANRRASRRSDGTSPTPNKPGAFHTVKVKANQVRVHYSRTFSS